MSHINSAGLLMRNPAPPDQPETLKLNSFLPQPKDYISAKKFLIRFDIESYRKSSQIEIKSKKRLAVVMPQIIKRPSAPEVNQFGDLTEGAQQGNHYQKIIKSQPWQNYHQQQISEELTKSSLIESRLSSRENLRIAKSNFSEMNKESHGRLQPTGSRQNKAPLKLYPIDSPTSAAKIKPEGYKEYIPRKDVKNQENFTHFKRSFSAPVLIENVERTENPLRLAQPLQVPAVVKRNRHLSGSNSYRGNETANSLQRDIHSKNFAMKSQYDDLDTKILQSKIIERTQQQSNLNFSVNYELFLVRKYKLGQSNAAVNADLTNKRSSSLGVSRYQLRKKFGVLDYRKMSSNDFQKLLQFSGDVNIKDLNAGSVNNIPSDAWAVQQFIEARHKQQAQLEAQLKRVRRSLSKSQAPSNDETTEAMGTRGLIGLHPTNRQLEKKNLTTTQTKFYDVLGRKKQRSVQSSFASKRDEIPVISENDMTQAGQIHYVLTNEKSFIQLESNKTSPRAKMIKDFKKSIREANSKPADQEIPSVYSYQISNKSKDLNQVLIDNDDEASEHQLDSMEIAKLEKKTVPIHVRKQ